MDWWRGHFLIEVIFIFIYKYDIDMKESIKINKTHPPD